MRIERPTPIGALAFVLASTASAQLTQRVSLDPSGSEVIGSSGIHSVAISGDGRFVAFESQSSALVPGDTNGWTDVFVRDRRCGTTELVSVSTSGVQGNYSSGEYGVRITPDGRFVAFSSYASNLVAGSSFGVLDLLLRDRQNGTTERVNADSNGVPANLSSELISITADGRYVVFTSQGTNLVPGDTNGRADVFLRDRQAGTTERLSVDANGAQLGLDSYGGSISDDGRYVAWESGSPNLVPGDTNGCGDIFLRDRQSGSLTRVSLGAGGTQGNADSYWASITPDARFLVFASDATNLVAGDTNGVTDIFWRDLQTGAVERVSVASGGVQANSYCFVPQVSADGRCVAFLGHATNLVPGDTNGDADAFVHDRVNGTTERANVASDGSQANLGIPFFSFSSDGRYVAFGSDATNLVPGDTGGWCDAFVRDRSAAGFTLLCEPGAQGVIACPCSNPPGGAGRGCDNSSATGGARLLASGAAYLSSDSLVFTSVDEKPTATSILLGGDAFAPTGFVFGQGIRCTAGSLKRMYVKNAIAGSITAPDFGAGDPTVSLRSAALGAPIQAGDLRYYLVYYRDPTVLGSCPSSSTFNATQTGVVSWWP